LQFRLRAISSLLLLAADQHRMQSSLVQAYLMVVQFEICVTYLDLPNMLNTSQKPWTAVDQHSEDPLFDCHLCSYLL